MNTDSLSDSTYYEGFWSLRNETVEVLMDEATFESYLKAYLTSHRIDPRTNAELLAYASTIERQHYEAERVLLDPDYWLQMMDPHIRIIQVPCLRQAVEVDETDATSQQA